MILNEEQQAGGELLISRAGDHVVVTLNRPARRNALSVALRDSISDALAELAEDTSVKAVVVTGTGTVFSAGFDLKEFDRAAVDDAFAQELWTSSDRFHHAVLSFPLPLLAAVNGPAVAGGFDLAVMSDLRIASSSAHFSHPERSFGDMVYGPLHDLVGGAVARELTIGGREAHGARGHGRPSCERRGRTGQPHGEGRGDGGSCVHRSERCSCADEGKGPSTCPGGPIEPDARSVTVERVRPFRAR